MKNLQLQLLRLGYCFAYYFDYVVGYMLTHPRNRPFYHRMMWEKYGTRYCTKEQFDEYWNEQSEEPSAGYVNQD